MGRWFAALAPRAARSSPVEISRFESKSRVILFAELFVFIENLTSLFTLRAKVLGQVVLSSRPPRTAVSRRGAVMLRPPRIPSNLILFYRPARVSPSCASFLKGGKSNRIVWFWKGSSVGNSWSSCRGGQGKPGLERDWSWSLCQDFRQKRRRNVEKYLGEDSCLDCILQSFCAAICKTLKAKGQKRKYSLILLAFSWEKKIPWLPHTIILKNA